MVARRHRLARIQFGPGLELKAEDYSIDIPDMDQEVPDGYDRAEDW
jgi:hypothetical protein